MKTKVAAIYGKRDVRLREFELPEITDNELLVSVISDSVCLSTWKAALLGSEHKRVPDDLSLIHICGKPGRRCTNRELAVLCVNGYTTVRWICTTFISATLPAPLACKNVQMCIRDRNQTVWAQVEELTYQQSQLFRRHFLSTESFYHDGGRFSHADCVGNRCV